MSKADDFGVPDVDIVAGLQQLRRRVKSERAGYRRRRVGLTYVWRRSDGRDGGPDAGKDDVAVVWLMPATGLSQPSKERK
jgi:hypothetical protein